jgi:hypothetical protein
MTSRTVRLWRTGVLSLGLLFVSIATYRPVIAQNDLPVPTRDINAVLAAHDNELLAIPAVVGVYVGTLDDRRTPCLKVMLVEKNADTERKIPAAIEGYPVVIEVTGEIRPLGGP